MTVVTSSGALRINVSGARGPRGLASGPLGAGTVDAETISNDSGQQDEILSKIASASTASGRIGHSHDAAYPGNTVGAWLNWLSENNDIRWYGYVADGASHPLSGVTRFKDVDTTGYTLGQWQALVPQITALTNEIDAIAVQAWYNDRPAGGKLILPAGEAVFNIGIVTGANQVVHLEGAARDLTDIRFTSVGTLWKHGYSGAVAASGIFTVKNLTITPAANAASACCFNVRFSGNQMAWCHNISDVLVFANDGNSYFTNVTITRNIKRGLDWENFNVYGRHFYVLGTSAHIFPSNVASDPDCPPGQANADAGDSYNFDNCMTVGYDYGWEYQWNSFSAALHSHEQGMWTNCQSYSGVGMVQVLDTNTAYAPADNWVILTPGWQGVGPAFDFAHCEHIRVRDGLLVADASSVNNITRIANLIGCTDAIIEGNEIFLEGAWTGGNCIGIGGASTANIILLNNMTVSYASSSEWLFVAATVPAGQVIERGSKFRGSGAYTAAHVTDASGGAVSQTRVKDIVNAVSSFSTSYSILNDDGDFSFRNVYSGNTDASGKFTVTLPAGLFRFIRSVDPTNGSPAVNSPVAVDSSSTTTVVVDFTALGGVTAVVLGIEVIGR